MGTVATDEKSDTEKEKIMSTGRDAIIDIREP
jgi:hypothetical protein